MSTQLLPNELPNGFLLTRQQYDQNDRLVLEYWLQTNLRELAKLTNVEVSGTSDQVEHEQGKTTVAVKLLVQDQYAVAFLKQTDVFAFSQMCIQQGLHIKIEDVKMQTFEKKRVAAFYAPSLKEFRKARLIAETLQIELFEDDVKPVDRYLMERFIQGQVAFWGECSNDGSSICFSNAKMKAGEYTCQPLSILSIDIECNEKGELFSIGLHELEQNFERVLFNQNGNTITQDFIEQTPSYIEWHQNEAQLLTAFVEHVNKLDPDCLVGWNFIGFDVRLIVEAAKRSGVRLSIGRDQSALRFSDGRRGSQRFPARSFAAGRVVLDGIEVLRNATYHFDSFSLDNVSRELLADQKLDISGSGGDKLAEIKRLYREEPIRLAEYNLQDCVLVSRIFAQEKLLDYLTTRSQLTGLELDKSGGSVAAFSNLYLPRMHRKGWVAPNLVAPEDYLHSPGGFVMESIPGLHNDVLVFDFKSLYPSIIRTFNIDPVALVEANDLESAQVIEGYRGGKFSRDKSILSGMLDDLWLAREKAKQENNAVFSNAIKIIMNSFYGVLGSAGCRFYDTKLASSITMRGHWVLNESKRWFEEQGFTVIYGDTDSVFVRLDNSTFSQSLAVELQQQLNVWWNSRIREEFNINSKLEMEFETHFDPFFMPTIRGTEAGSKKRYAGKKLSAEGQSTIVYKGLESVRSDWTQLAKDFQAELFNLIFTTQLDKDNLVNCVKQTLQDLYSGKLDEKCIYQKRIRQNLPEYIKTTPPQIKAARLANNHYGRAVYEKGSVIQYVINVNGPCEYVANNAPLDYEHYIQKQLFPIAESILHSTAPEVLSLFDRQLSLL